jgi:putative FmdB family regulatory protein
MPIYEFVCENCGEPFDELIFRTEDLNRIACPECESDSVRKKISLIGARSTGTATSISSSNACTTST